MSLVRTIVESPYAGDVAANTDYARAALAHSFSQGEAPFASHLLYTQPGVLNDLVPEERTLGIDAGLVWGSQADRTAVYAGRGLSGGMLYGIQRALEDDREIVFRTLPGDSISIGHMQSDHSADGVLLRAADESSAIKHFGRTDLKVLLIAYRSDRPWTKSNFADVPTVVVTRRGVQTSIVIPRTGGSREQGAHIGAQASGHTVADFTGCAAVAQGFCDEFVKTVLGRAKTLTIVGGSDRAQTLLSESAARRGLSDRFEVS